MAAVAPPQQKQHRVEMRQLVQWCSWRTRRKTREIWAPCRVHQRHAASDHWRMDSVPQGEGHGKKFLAALILFTPRVNNSDSALAETFCFSKYCCEETKQRAEVGVENTSSDRDSEDPSYLNYISLARRLSIVVDVADALAYLHHNHQGTIVHCDLKPSNILLDGDMVAHVGDFGLARFKSDSSRSSFADSNSTSSLAINGTIGYIAPECAGGGQVSTAADVYSFGVVLLEIFIRKKPTDDMFKDGMNIAKCTEINFPDKVLQIVDPQLLQDPDICEGEILLSVLDVGIRCTNPSPSERINMQEVATKLRGIRDAYLTGS